MQVRRIKAARRLTLVPLIDVLFILLVYFMVTSVYRDLDMIPVVRVGDAAPSVGMAGMAPVGASVLLRLTADGQIAVRGSVLDAAELTRLLDEARETEVRVLILPLGSAPLSALTDLLDAVAQAGVTDARLIRLEAEE